MPNPNPVIVVPGITASCLSDEYPLPQEIVWSAVLNKDYQRISLHPDNTRYEALEPARVQPGPIFEVAYRELVEELRYNLREKEDKAVPVFPFSYDWRQPLALTEARLAAFVDEVIERTLLLRHYAEDDAYAAAPKVNLVAHSMGGLLVTGYLEAAGKKARVGKVATLATPYKGSFEAVVKLATGTANLGSSPPSSREREAARVTPALYQLLPTCAGLEPGKGMPPTLTLFDPGAWQTGILQTLEEYVRLHAVSKKDRKQQAADLFTSLLNGAKDHRARVEKFTLKQAGLAKEDWLCVVGVDTETRVKLTVNKESYGPDFEFSGGRHNEWGNADQKLRRLTGDGTVPFEGALPSFLGVENIVCVRPEDYGYWELQDRLISAAAGFHGILPNMDMVHRMLVRFFTGRGDKRGNTWGRPAPGVAKWEPPLELELKD